MKQNKTFFILGITGGAGSGKTTVVECIKKIAPVVFLHCDVIAHELMQPKGASYDALIEEFGSSILEENINSSPISREKLAKIAMATKESRNRLNEITHPLVRKAIEQKLDLLQKEQFSGIVIIEAALLIEAGYKEICDELWYVHAPIEDRKRRMRQNRGYTEQKIDNILAGQLSEQQFLANADVVIENPDRQNEEEELKLSKQIRAHLKERLESIH